MKSEERPKLIELEGWTHRQRLYVLYLFSKRQVPIVAFCFCAASGQKKEERNPNIHRGRSHKIQKEKLELRSKI